jgi:hypothetical protein
MGIFLHLGRDFQFGGSVSAVACKENADKSRR